MKDFRIELNNPPGGVYFPGMLVTGFVICVTDTPKDYERLAVTLDGRAEVLFTTTCTGATRTSNEKYVSCSEDLWTKNFSFQGEDFPVGTNCFNFSFQLPQTNLPPSLQQEIFGSIKYSVTATIIKSSRHGLLGTIGRFARGDKTVTAIFNVQNLITINRPELTRPVSKEVQKAACCLLCTSVPIVVTAEIPRSGFCIGHDNIPVSITIENDRCRTIRGITVQLKKRVICKAERQQRFNWDLIQTRFINSSAIGNRHNSTLYHVDPIQITLLDTYITSLENCGIISIDYFLTINVTSLVHFPHIEIPIVLGNVPLDNQRESQCLRTVGFQPLPSCQSDSVCTSTNPLLQRPNQGFSVQPSAPDLPPPPSYSEIYHQ